MEYYLIFIVTFAVFFIVAFLIFCWSYFSRQSENREKQENTNRHVRDFLRKNALNVTKIFYLTDNFTYNQTHECKKQLLVDSGSKKIILVDYDSGKFLIIDFNEIVNYEIYENGGNVTTGAAAGGWFVGFFGAETTGKCNELRLIIRLKKYDRPQVSYKLVSDTIFNSGIAKNSAQYKQVVSDLQDVVSFLEVVKEENMKNKNDQA